MNTTIETKHTPTPWYVNRDESHTYISPDLTLRHGGPILRILPQYSENSGNRMGAIEQANAAFIVRAANCHDQLVEALQETRAWLHHYQTCAIALPSGKLSKSVCAALAAAKEGQP